MPVGWSADGAWVYAHDGDKYVKIPTSGSGEAETVFEWPFEDKSEHDCRPAAGGTKWICHVGESNSDIWLVENFDPDVN